MIKHDDDPFVWGNRKIDLRYKAPVETQNCLKLWFYVIVNAYETALWKRHKYKNKSKYRSIEIRIAREWIFSNDKSHGNSFLNLCSLCGVNPQKIRAKLRKEMRAR